MSAEIKEVKDMNENEDPCQVPGCDAEPIVDDYGVIVCAAHLTPEIEAYLRRQHNRDAAR